MINQNIRIADQIQPYYKRESILSGRLSDDFSFSGAKTVKVLTPLTVDMNDYTRSGSARYGTPAEMQDIVQELTLTQDRSFTMTVDKGNLDDGNFLKDAYKMLALQIREKAIPEMEKYVLRGLARQAGTVVGSATAASASNICELISAGTQQLDDSEVPQTDRTLFVSSASYKLLKHSTEFLAVESIAREALKKGVVGRYDGMDVVKVPSGRWPAFVNFMIVHKEAAIAPVKLDETNIHDNPPGISGRLIEGRQYYDVFVFGVRCDGVYVHVDTGSGKGTVVAAPAVAAGTGAITCATAGAVVRWSPRPCISARKRLASKSARRCR